MKITIFKNPKEVDNNTLKYIKLLEQSKDFWKLIEIVRKKSNIPQGGYLFLDDKLPIKQQKVIIKQILEPWPELDRKGPRHRAIVRSSLIILLLLDLPESWFFAITTIIMFNLIFPPSSYQDSFETKYIDTRVPKTKQDAFRPERSVQISIKEKMTIKEIVNQINKHKNQLLKQISNLPSGPQQITWLNKTKNIDIKTRIKELKESGKTYKEIGDKILSENNDSSISFELSKSQLSTYLKRFNRTINKIITDKPSLNYIYKEAKKQKLTS